MDMEPSRQEAAMIVCQDVHKWYGHFHALRGVAMEVNKGEVIVIFGPSGSGKSTFIRTLNRLEEHQRGQIIVDGIELSHDVRNIEKVRMETGMVFQSFNLFPHLTVMQNISLAPILANSPVASNNALRLPAHWPCSPKSCSSMSPPQLWTPR